MVNETTATSVPIRAMNQLYREVGMTCYLRPAGCAVDAGKLTSMNRIGRVGRWLTVKTQVGEDPPHKCHRLDSDRVIGSKSPPYQPSKRA